MMRTLPARRIGLCVGAAVGLGAIAGCLDLGLVSDIAFAPNVPGLPSDQPWVALPVGAWVVEGGLHADAVAGCFAAGCAPQAAVGVFRAEGSDAAAIARLVADPAPLMRFLQEGERRTKVRPGGKRGPISVTAERIRDAGGSGFTIRLSRLDGGHAAYGVVLSRSRPGGTSLVLVISPSQDGARRLATDVAARLG